MNDNTETIIRTVQISDLEKLKSFFIKAYGPNTIFQNEKFLNHFFDAGLNDKPVFSNCLIAINNGEIVAHYGGLEYKLRINNEIKTMTWGVSAYTLPAHRGKGLNSKIVDYITNNFEINGVIGFTSQTSLFYQKLGYNIFNFEKFTRHILVLDYEKTLEVCNHIHQDCKHILDQNQTVKKILENTYPGTVIELTAANIDNYTLNLDEYFPEITTTQRTKEFIKWRFLKYPFLKYNLYGIVQEDVIIAYIALREETLSPFTHTVNRIIDLFGRPDAIKTLLHQTVKESVSKNHIYIDFAKYGDLFETELHTFNFIHLENDDCCILPQVTSPIEDRPNGEFIGILSKSFSHKIKNLSRNNVYFTRMDSDRDRLANINQINKNQA